MSVINQMLRDLDSRQKTGQTAVSAGPALRDIRRDTVSVASISPARNRATAARRMALVLALLAALGLAGWMFKQHPEAPAATQDAAAEAVLAQPPTRSETRPAPVPAARIAAAPAPPLQVVATPAANPVPHPAAHVPQASASEVRAAASGPASAPPKDAEHGPSGSSVAAVASAPAPSAAATTTPKQEAAPAQSSRTQAAMDVMAQAQSLWEQGARDSATQLLRDAIAVLERSGGDSAGPLLQAVKELTRMELAQGHAAAAMDLLLRLEPLLANQPDAWGLRGNVAQRLGRHAESVHAYLNALKLRPGEARWMLGAAVSLAAGGHAVQAAELAEQARERGGLSPEVEAYLRQQGVVLRQP